MILAKKKMPIYCTISAGTGKDVLVSLLGLTFMLHWNGDLFWLTCLPTLSLKGK